MRGRGTHLESYPIGVFPLPEAVNNMNPDETSRVLIKCVHEEGDVVEVVELPTLGDERVAEEVAERDDINVI